MEQTKNNEVLELLPISIVNSNNFSPKCKFLIATLLFLNGLDKVKNDGYFFRTNQTLAKEANMTEANLLINLRKLESLNFISRKAGKRKEASEYVIYENTINSYVEIPMKVKKYAIAKSNNSDNSDSNNNSNKIDDIMLRISNIENALLVIQNTIDKIYHYCNSNNNSNNCNSTDTESDIDTDIEKESINNIILNNNINYNIEKIKTELVDTIDDLEKEVEANETSLNKQNKIDSDNNSIEIKNNMNKEINKTNIVDNPTTYNCTNSILTNDFKATGKTLTNKTVEDTNECVIVENNALECVISTIEEIDTVQLDINKLCNNIDYILDLTRYCNEGSLPIDNIENTMLFISELENKCYTEISIYFYNDRILDAGKEHLLNKINECKKTIEYLFQQLNKLDNQTESNKTRSEVITIDESNNSDNPIELNKTSSEIITIDEVITIDELSNSDNNSNKTELNSNPIGNNRSSVIVNDSKATDNTLMDKTIEDTNENANVENNVLECVIPTTEENTNKYTIDESSNSNSTINNSNKEMNEFNIETPVGFIHYINFQLESSKMTKEEYKREIDFYRRNYSSSYNIIKQLVLPIAA